MKPATIFFAPVSVLILSVAVLPSVFSPNSAFAINITGNSDGEHLVGTNAQDYISGQGGDDFIEGLAGPDNLFGRDGNDMIDAGLGFDKLSGAKGNDTLIGGRGNDILRGGLGADSFNCGEGIDTVTDFAEAEGDIVDNNCENVLEKKLVIWYGASRQDFFSPGNDAVLRLQNFGLMVEHRGRPISDLTGAKVVVITGQFSAIFSEEEKSVIEEYVNQGGRLVLATDTDYFFCNPPSLCAMEISREFGFAFGNDVSGTIIPAAGQSNHPIWTSPNSMTSFNSWCCDAQVVSVIDSGNVNILGRLQDNSIAIVLNENPAYQGGSVMGIGHNMLLGLNGDFRMFDNVMTFMLDRSLVP